MSNAAPDVKSIFGRALEIASPSGRAAYLQEVCGGDDAVRAEVEGLLRALDRAGAFLNRPVPVNYAVGPTVFPITMGLSLAVKDFNGDGIPDLAVVLAGAGGVRVLLGNGDGTFQTSPISYLAGVAPVCCAVADFNGDGLPDLAVADVDPHGGVSILFNDGMWAP